MILAIPLQEALVVIEKEGLLSEIRYTFPFADQNFVGEMERVVRVKTEDNLVKLVVAKEIRG
ncbi:MAG: hypothetical protein HGA27_01045 [Peptococcaceae bacterium]|nr:hypothetical protein [Peptococcaceae bacterium]